MKEQLEAGLGRLSLRVSFLYRTGFWAEPSVMGNPQSPTTTLSQKTPPASAILTSWPAGPSAAPWQSGQISSVCFSWNSTTSWCFRRSMLFLGVFSQNCRTCASRAAQIGFYDWPSARGEKLHTVFECVWMKFQKRHSFCFFVKYSLCW